MQVNKQSGYNYYAQKLCLNNRLLGWNVIVEVNFPRKEPNISFKDKEY